MKYLSEFHSKSKLLSRSISTLTDFHAYSTDKIAAIRSHLKKRLQTVQCEGDYCIVAVGSYGRYEASAQSDLDVYVIYSKKMSAATEKTINKIIRDIAMKAGVKCSVGFESISIDAMYKNIGGKEDTNPSITNRILFLLESACLFNEPSFNDAYEKILKKYLKDIIKSDNKPPRFLLSDIIRYYRTICVDYEFKTTEGNKKWAIEQKMTDAYKDILVLYADFLREIGKESAREHLDNLKNADREKDKVFLTMTEKSRQFNDKLLGLLNDCKWGDKNYLDFIVL